MPSDPSFGRTDLFHLVMIGNTFQDQVLRRSREPKEALELAVVVGAQQTFSVRVRSMSRSTSARTASGSCSIVVTINLAAASDTVPAACAAARVG